MGHTQRSTVDNFTIADPENVMTMMMMHTYAIASNTESRRGKHDILTTLQQSNTST